jgi:hypothetical protein
MDEIVEQGFDRLCAQVTETKNAKEEVLDAIIANNVAFLEKMIKA